jgi:transcriptional regulator with XRE-family HTH domain
MAKKVSTGFAARLRELREAAGLTQAQLAERAGMHLHGLTKLEQGDREPAWATVIALAEALGVSCDGFRQPPAERPPRAGGRPPKPSGQDAEPPASKKSRKPKK